MRFQVTKGFRQKKIKNVGGLKSHFKKKDHESFEKSPLLNFDRNARKTQK